MVQPGLNAPQGHWAQAPRSVVGLGKAAWILAYVTAGAALILAFGEWHAYSLARDYLAGRGATVADVVAADNLDSRLSLFSVATTIATAVLLIVWAYQARQNAELICTMQHRRSRGWVIGAWFCPVVNLWFPPMIVEDIYRASMPSTRHDQVSSIGMPGVPLIRFWWAPFILAGVVTYFTSRDTNTLDGLHTEVVGFVLRGLLLVASAVPLMRIIRRVSEWQLEPKQH
ncbi:DUF4328 domain-containing protein [Labedaea rhizosphaerae]|uniref:Uncharacterized protein DUF4328 n=1 Tax=Labedaea rhizosphaerae TaxID=598644 RepID=A0A4R6SNY7_LABRH|nr:DUF4328 domain-containing protein [Labedaea rhizosphaerae]TDQ05641.1 uncharacterized protein DUF4328 [Labedaea rhizosphaerae]